MSGLSSVMANAMFGLALVLVMIVNKFPIPPLVIICSSAPCSVCKVALVAAICIWMAMTF